jgi:hypothetical protein
MDGPRALTVERALIASLNGDERAWRGPILIVGHGIEIDERLDARHAPFEEDEILHAARELLGGGSPSSAPERSVVVGEVVSRLAREPRLLPDVDLRASLCLAPRADGTVGERRFEPRVDVVNEFTARLWGERLHVVAPVVDLSAHGMLLGCERGVAAAERVRVELIGRMWRFAARARIVSCSEDAVRLKVIEWDGRAFERVREFVRDRVRLLDA